MGTCFLPSVPFDSDPFDLEDDVTLLPVDATSNPVDEAYLDLLPGQYDCTIVVDP